MLKRSNGVVMMMVAMAAVVTLLTSGIAFAITPEDPNVVPDEDPIEDPVVNPDDEDEGIVNNVFAANIIRGRIGLGRRKYCLWYSCKHRRIS